MTTNQGGLRHGAAPFSIDARSSLRGAPIAWAVGFWPCQSF
ncbi:MAG: hypothetical protein ACXIVG_12690 [Pararhodobacter sp.]